jgi:superfamily I DNA/RNA helicase
MMNDARHEIGGNVNILLLCLRRKPRKRRCSDAPERWKQNTWNDLQRNVTKGRCEMLRIFGPPGTGKTTTLLNMVDRALESGVNPNQIAFLAFTRKAANEAKESARWSASGWTHRKTCVFFRTIHSLALVHARTSRDRAGHAA